MRVTIDHITRYRFSEGQARLVQLLRMSPGDTVDQTVVNWHIGVSCDVRLREALDGYGNRVTMLYADGPLDEIEIVVTGEVLTGGDGGLVRGTVEPLPCEVYLRPTERTRADDAIRALAGDSDDVADAVATRLGERLRCADEEADSGRAAAEVLAGDAASPRDLAHVFIAACRSAGLPARYVSGYRANECGTTSAPHAWGEVHVAGTGWIGYDPCHGGRVDERYVRVAVALDAGGAAPVSGSRTGRGREVMDVDVQVAGD